MRPPGDPAGGRAGVEAALLVGVATALTFGVFVGRFGLYYDDYPSWSLYLTEGTAALVSFTAGQARPLVGLLPALAGSVTGSHVLMLVVHTLNGLAFLALLRRLWPGAGRATGLAAVLFCVYPAYWLRPTHIALAIDGSLLVALLSLWSGLVALDRSGRARSALTALSVVLVPSYLLLYELPLGLELVRPALVALDRRRAGERPGWRRLLALWSPWVLVLGAFGAWRTVVFEPAGDYARLRYNAVRLPATPGEVWSLAGRTVSSILDLLVGTWRHVLPDPALAGREVGMAAGAAVVLVIAAALWAWRSRAAATPGARPVVEMAGLGLLIALAGQAAPAATRHLARAEGLDSRWALVSTLGVALTWAALAAWRPAGRGRVVASAGTGVVLVLIGLGAFRHAENAFAFARDWEAQRQTWWQLAWRVGTPAPGTVVVLDDTRAPALDRERFEYELTLGAELFFGAEGDLVATTSGLAVAGRRAGPPRSFELMGRTWRVDLERALLVLTGAGCLEVALPGHVLPEGKALTDDGRRVLSRARPPLLEPADCPPPPGRALFGPEPDGWCRTYQEARRAEQRGDDEAVVRLGEAAWSRGEAPEVSSEWDLFRKASVRARGRAFPPRGLP